MSTARIRLQPLLAFDAATCMAMGALLLAASETIAALTYLPASLLFWAGAVLLPIAVFIGGLSRVQPPPRWAVMVVIVGNIAWGLASIVLPTLGLVQPNALGWIFMLGQAAVVLLLAMLEYGTPATAVATR
ncbi:hypothetical protein [Castellaniella sp.]|uniref:hypothetical protein n=1 Tax=Castellaniella sp. TaxID=1955812 RepID=UPI002AFEC838|nr:hypothetical protein [Castellaniella sp.]